MAETYGRLTGQAGVCSATLGPGAINLLLGTADATTNSTPLVALSAQVGMDRSFKESHQGVDLVSMFAPVTKWSALIATPGAVPEMVRKAFKLAQTERPGAVYLAVPEDVETATAPADAEPLPINIPRPDEPSAAAGGPGRVDPAGRRQPHRAGRSRRHPGRRRTEPAPLRRERSACRWPPPSTARGCSPTTMPQALGAVGFMRHDYVNFGFDRADVIVTVGYELQEFDPVRINPAGRQADHPHPPVSGRGGPPLQRRRRPAGRYRPQPRRRWPRRWTARSATRRTSSASVAYWPMSSSGAGPTTGSRWPRPGSWPTPGRPSTATTSCWSTPVRSRCGWPGSTRPTPPTPASSPTACRPWRGRCPGRSGRRSPGPRPRCWWPPATAPSS